VVVAAELHGYVAAFGGGVQQVPYVLLLFSEGTAVDAGEADRTRSGRGEADGRLGAGPSGPGGELPVGLQSAAHRRHPGMRPSSESSSRTCARLVFSSGRTKSDGVIVSAGRGVP
jgi:hypothetical protein